MNKKMIGLLMILLIATLALSACERPATRAPGGAATPTSEIPFPVATQPQIMVDILKGTQTAAALTPQTGGGISATSTPSFAFSTPAAGTPAAVTSAPAVVNTPYPASTPGKPASYTLLHGEFPYCIARRFNVNPVDLLSMNGLNMDSFPATGTTLNIPTSGTFPGERSLKAHPTTYTVRAGETIGMVACYFGDVDPNIIYSANGITAGTALTTGQVLQIP
jgi:LysM repeat protein